MPFLRWNNTEIIGKKFYGFGDTSLYQYETGSLKLVEYSTPILFKKAMQIKAGNGKVYVLRKEGLQQFLVK